MSCKSNWRFSGSTSQQWWRGRGRGRGPFITTKGMDGQTDNIYNIFTLVSHKVEIPEKKIMNLTS